MPPRIDVTAVYRSSKKHSDADCLLRASVDPVPQDFDEDGLFFGIGTVSDLASQQRAGHESGVMIDYTDGRNIAMPRAFKQNLLCSA